MEEQSAQNAEKIILDTQTAQNAEKIILNAITNRLALFAMRSVYDLRNFVQTPDTQEESDAREFLNSTIYQCNRSDDINNIYKYIYSKAYNFDNYSYYFYLRKENWKKIKIGDLLIAIHEGHKRATVYIGI